MVENLLDFNFLCCPECHFKSKDYELFVGHAIANHPKSKESDIFSEAEEKIPNLKKFLKDGSESLNDECSRILL